MPRSAVGLTRTPAIRRLQVATLAIVAVASALMIAALLRGSSSVVPLHVSSMFLIALGVYGWLILPTMAAILASLAAAGLGAWAWAVGRHGVLGADLAVGAVLIGWSAWQQHRRHLRLMHVDQAMNDIQEEALLVGQQRRLAQEAQEALGRKLSRYQQLQSIAEEFSRVNELPGIARFAVRQTFELIGKSDVCLLFLVDEERRELALIASERAEGVAIVRSKQGDQFDHHVLRSQRPLLVNDARKDFRFSHLGLGDRPARSVIACPVRLGQRAEGVLRLDSPEPNAYTQDDLRFLDILLDLVDTAMTNARLFARTQELALTDGLTGLARRQPFVESLGRELSRANRSRKPLSVLMLDLDDFKRYNDTFGHSAGDIVLKTLAEVMRSCAPEEAMCARYGGEEFSVILPKTPPAKARELAENIRRSFLSTARAVGQGAGRDVTVSIGVASYPEDGRSDTELIRRADQRLYQAKRAGKNQVCAASQ